MERGLYNPYETAQATNRRKEINRMTDTEWGIAWENICRKLRKKYPEHIKLITLVDRGY